jgi:molybdopterin converting factor small subunit
MKVKIEFLALPSLTKVIGARRIEIEVNEGTPKNVLDSLLKKFGRSAKEALLDDKGKLDRAIQILLNGEKWIPHDKLDSTLKDGDTLIFMMLVAGG